MSLADNGEVTIAVRVAAENDRGWLVSLPMAGRHTQIWVNRVEAKLVQAGPGWPMMRIQARIAKRKGLIE